MLPSGPGKGRVSVARTLSAARGLSLRRMVLAISGAILVVFFTGCGESTGELAPDLPVDVRVVKVSSVSPLDQLRSLSSGSGPISDQDYYNLLRNGIDSPLALRLFGNDSRIAAATGHDEETVRRWDWRGQAKELVFHSDFRVQIDIAVKNTSDHPVTINPQSWLVSEYNFYQFHGVAPDSYSFRVHRLQFEPNTPESVSLTPGEEAVIKGLTFFPSYGKLSIIGKHFYPLYFGPANVLRTLPRFPEIQRPSLRKTVVQSNNAWLSTGNFLVVCGQVENSRYAETSKGKPTFLNFAELNADHLFTVVIWGDSRENFPPHPESYYIGKQVCVTGLIESYQGKPQIVAEDAVQLHVIR